jgi:hypothetical protein
MSQTKKWVAKAFHVGSSARKMTQWPRETISSLAKLEILDIDVGTDRVHANVFTLSAADILAFPPTLTSLKLTISQSLTDETVRLLPRSLTSLILDNEGLLSGDVISDFPQGLLEFSVWMPGIRNHHIARLPPGLTKLCLWTGASHFTKPEVANNLPVHITRLRISYLSQEIGALYYERLVKLGIATEEQTRVHNEGQWGRF